MYKRQVQDIPVDRVGGDMPVAQRDVAAVVLGELRVVGHEYDGTSLGMQFLEKNQYLERGKMCIRDRVIAGPLYAGSLFFSGSERCAGGKNGLQL